MKKLWIILTIFTVMNVGNAQTNVYHPFPDSNAFWGVRMTNSFYPEFWQDIRYGMNGDTTINGMLYHKVYQLFDSTLTNPNSTYYAAIREENKRIYTIGMFAPEETILYDFNLLIGDTITYNYPDILPDDFGRIVINIDSVLLFTNEYRKRYTMVSIGGHGGVTDTIIEGIGSICRSGLFNPLQCAWPSNGSSLLFTCFKQDEIIHYLNNPVCDHCFCSLYVTGVEDHKELEVHIYPNPFSNHTIIESADYLTNATLTLYNSLGQQVKQLNSISGKEIILQREGLPGGLYFFNISQNNKIIRTDKLMISNN